MRPEYRITADGADVTDRFQGRVSSIEVRDAAGVQSDTATIIIDNEDGLVAPPRKGAELEIFLGFEGEGLTSIGRYAVTSRSAEGPVRLITINASAVDLRIGAKSPKTRGWKDVTLSEIVETIAAEHGLIPAVAAELRDVRFNHLSQTGESDLHFLTRIALDLGAIAKVADGRLIVAWRGKGETVSGERLPTISLAETSFSTWKAIDGDRERHEACHAWWHDGGAGERKKVTVGEGSPDFEIRRPYPTIEGAQRAAAAKLEELNRSARTFRGSLAKAALDLRAEQPIRLFGLDDLADGDWIATTVTHRLDGALTTHFEAELLE